MSHVVANPSPRSKDKGRSKGAPSPWRQKKKPKQQVEFPGLRSLNGKWGYLFIAPFIIMFLIFGLAPVLYSTIIAFYQYDPLGEQTFIGLDNFMYLLR